MNHNFNQFNNTPSMSNPFNNTPKSQDNTLDEYKKLGLNIFSSADRAKFERYKLSDEYLGIGKDNQRGFNQALTSLRRGYGNAKEELAPYRQYDRENAATIQAFLRDPSKVTSLPGYAYGMDKSMDAVNDAYAAAGNTGGADFLSAVGRNVQNNYEQGVNNYVDMYQPRYNTANTLANLHTRFGEGRGAIQVDRSNDLTENKLAAFTLRNPKAFAVPAAPQQQPGTLDRFGQLVGIGATIAGMPGAGTAATFAGDIIGGIF